MKQKQIKYRPRDNRRGRETHERYCDVMDIKLERYRLKEQRLLRREQFRHQLPLLVGSVATGWLLLCLILAALVVLLLS